MSQRPRMPRSSILRRVLGAGVLLVLGVVATVAFAWGAIFWRICVSRPFLNVGEGVPASRNVWPLRVTAEWPERPQSVAVTRDLGYERRVANRWVHLVRRADAPDAEWVDADSREAIVLEEEEARSNGSALLRLRERNENRPPRRDGSQPEPIRVLTLEHRVRQYEVFRRRSGFPFLCMESSWRDHSGYDYRDGASPTRTFAARSLSGPMPLGGVSADGRGWTWGMHYHRGIPWPQDVVLPNAAGAPFNLPLKPVWPLFVLNVLLWAAGPAALLRARRVWRTRQRVRRGLCPWCRYPMGVSEVCTECGRTLPARTTGVGVGVGAEASP